MSAPGDRSRESALEAMHEEEALGRAYDTALMARLWGYVRPYVWQVALTLSLVFPLFLTEVLPAWIIKTGLDTVVPPSAEQAAAEREGVTSWLLEPLVALLEPPGGIPPLHWLAGLFLVAVFGNSLLQFLNSYVMARTGQAAMRDLRHDVFAHIQKLHLGFFDRYPVGRLVTRCTNDVENVAEMFSAGIVALVTDVLKMVGFAAVLFVVDAKLALLTFLVIPPLAVFAVVFRLKVRQAYRLVRVRIARINAYVQENVTGMREVQLFSREARNRREFDDMNAAHRDAWYQSIRYDSALFSVVELAQNLTFAIILWQATGMASFGTIYLFIDLLRRFFMPLRDLSAKYSVMQSSMASAERIFQLLDTEPEVADHAHAIPHRASARVSEQSGAPPQAREARAQRAAGERSRTDASPVSSASPVFSASPAEGKVEFQHVWFAYAGDSGDDTDWVLRDLSFTVEPGERVAFVGATGAGKTTVLKLLTRLYEPTHGRVLLDGVDLRDLTQENLRRRVAMVLQDVFLFSGTIAENIALDREDVDRATVERVSRAVQAHRFVEALPEGYDTEVRERGSNFSAGQRQLLSFARALAHGADVLVLDEATSSIDTETEALVQEGIHALMEGRTALVVAHRLSTIQDVDRIYVLDQGRVAEAGSHEDLLAREGLYWRLHHLQVEAPESRPAAAAGG
ncbi:MAG: ABC transporter ATP-binding protein [Myxococcota bacterium]|nr:ABC transporter ATP-binding protein [Myxococcota bacterium]